MHEFAKSFAIGGATAAATFALVIIGSGPIATCGILLTCLFVRTATPLGIGAWLLGGSAGLASALYLLPDWGVDGVATAIVAAIVAATALRDPRALDDRELAPADPLRNRSWFRDASPILAAAMALALVAGTGVRRVTTICGLDARSLVYSLCAILLVAALGAAIAGFLLRRHLLPRIFLPAALAVLVAAQLLLGAGTFPDVLATLERIQAPAASRGAWLFGTSLGTIVLCGLPMFGLGALLETAVRRADLWSAKLATPVGFAIGGFLGALVDVVPAVPAALALVAAAQLTFAHTPRVKTLAGFASTALLAVIAWRNPGAPPPAFVLSDPHALYFGEETLHFGEETPYLGEETDDGEETVPAEPTKNGRPRLAFDPPGWPFQSEPLAATLELVRAATREGEILLIGDEAAALASRSDDASLSIDPQRAVGGSARRAAVVLLPSTFSERLRYFARFPEFVSRAERSLSPSGRFVVVADLAEIDLESLAAVVRAVRTTTLTPRILIHGRHAIVFADRSPASSAADSALAALARMPRPALLLGAEDTALLATFGVSPHHPAHEYLLLGEGRARLPHGTPKRASDNLRSLLRRTRATRDGAPEDTRIRLELAAAILDDDYVTEDRLLRLLGRAGAEDAPRLLIQRARARDRIVEYLLDEREDATRSLDADLRFRVGRVMRGCGNTLAAIDEFVRVIELRPHLLEAPVALAEVFVDADAKRQVRQVHGYVQHGRMMPFQIDPFVAGLDDEKLLARLEVARGISDLRSALERSDGSRDGLLRVALGRFGYAADLDPASADAIRLYGECLFHLGKRGAAREYAMRAIAASPLDPRSHALLAAATDDPREAITARAEALRLDP